MTQPITEIYPTVVYKLLKKDAGGRPAEFGQDLSLQQSRPKKKIALRQTGSTSASCLPYVVYTILEMRFSTQLRNSQAMPTVINLGGNRSIRITVSTIAKALTSTPMKLEVR